jgi:hypothetical protein
MLYTQNTAGDQRRLETDEWLRIEQLYFCVVTSEAEPAGRQPALIDVSASEIKMAWTEAMAAYALQVYIRNYVDFQLARAHLQDLHIGIGHAQLLFPLDPLIFNFFTPLNREARRF